MSISTCGVQPWWFCIAAWKTGEKNECYSCVLGSGCNGLLVFIGWLCNFISSGQFVYRFDLAPSCDIKSRSCKKGWNSHCKFIFFINCNRGCKYRYGCAQWRYHSNTKRGLESKQHPWHNWNLHDYSARKLICSTTVLSNLFF